MSILKGEKSGLNYRERRLSGNTIHQQIPVTEANTNWFSIQAIPPKLLKGPQVALLFELNIQCTSQVSDSAEWVESLSGLAYASIVDRRMQGLRKTMLVTV